MSCFLTHGVRTVRRAKVAEAIKMPLRACARAGPRNHELSGELDPPQEKEQFWGHLTAHCEVKGMSGMSQLFNRWLQLFGHSQSVLLQLILILSVLCFCVMNGTGLPRLSRKRGH